MGFTVYVLIGAPASGKTTWARENALRLGAEIVSSDEVRWEMQRGGWGDPRDLAQVFAEVARRARVHLAAGRNVILDATHWLRRHRRYAAALARESGARAVAVWIDTPLDVCLARNAARSHSGWGARTDDQAVIDMHGALEPPSAEEFEEVKHVCGTP